MSAFSKVSGNCLFETFSLPKLIVQMGMQISRYAVYQRNGSRFQIDSNNLLLVTNLLRIVTCSATKVKVMTLATGESPGLLEFFANINILFFS